MKEDDFHSSPIYCGTYACESCWNKIHWLSRPLSQTSYAAVHYAPPINDALHRFKYKEDSLSLSYFIGLMDTAAKKFSLSQQLDFIIPVPLHTKRLQERGYNQSLLLARGLSRKWGIPIDFSHLKRTKTGPNQTELSARERIKNVQNKFELSTKHRNKLAGKRVLLVDDVFTTGATTQACADILLSKAKAKEVKTFTLAYSITGGSIP